jgi:hypothetical protein
VQRGARDAHAALSESSSTTTTTTTTIRSGATAQASASAEAVGSLREGGATPHSGGSGVTSPRPERLLPTSPRENLASSKSSSPPPLPNAPAATSPAPSVSSPFPPAIPVEQAPTSLPSIVSPRPSTSLVSPRAEGPDSGAASPGTSPRNYWQNIKEFLQF